jgi:hypothetical protein
MGAGVSCLAHITGLVAIENNPVATGRGLLSSKMDIPSTTLVGEREDGGSAQ